MIITELGVDQVNRDLETNITRVVFSDLSLHYVINPASLTSVTGGNTNSVEPTIGLLYNGTLNVQATNKGNFSAQSAFIFAKNDEEFLIAVSPVSNNRVSGELSISKIRKLSFNALANDLVLKPELNSVVASAMAELPHPDFNSIVDSAASGINSAANGYTDNAIKTVNSGLASKADTSTINDINSALNSKADKSVLSNYATVEVLTDVSSGITSELAKKADINALSNKADVATINDIKTVLSGKADADVLSSYATNSTVNDIKTELNDKASVADLSKYYTASNAADSFKSVDNIFDTKARASDLKQLSGEVINNRNAMDSGMDNLKQNIDLTPQPAIVNGTSLDTIVSTGMYPMDNVDLGSLPANLGLPHTVISGALIVRREFNLVQQTIKDNVGNIYVRNMGRAWSKFKSAEIDNVSRDELNNTVKDNHDGTITFNGIELSLNGMIDSHADLFKISKPGVWLSNWGYQDTLDNYPSTNGAATIVALGGNRDTNGLKLIVIDSWGGEYTTHWANGYYRPWEKSISRSEIDEMSKTHFKYQNSYKGNLLDLDKEDDGAYDLYGNMQGTPEGFYGYGLALKYHNAWNAFIILFDNAQGIWTNRQGPNGWNGWRRLVTADMLTSMQEDIEKLKQK